MTISQCPVCQGKWGGEFKLLRQEAFGSAYIDCGTCGNYEITKEAMEDYFVDSEERLSDRFRAMVSHRINEGKSSKKEPIIKSDWVERLIKNPIYTSPSQQASNAIRYIGDQVDKTGKAIIQIPAQSFFAIVGSPNPDFAASILDQLYRRDLVLGTSLGAINTFMDATLSLDGWQVYESEKIGKLSTNQGFMALKFSNGNLKKLLDEVMKLAIESIGFKLTDMRDSLKAGVIDNLMRERIRDAAFVIADLTDDNYGAYWEAGFAEGLGKPVIYICEEQKFQSASTHFDTNHSTTLKWGGSIPEEQFASELKATLRNSLALLPTN
jgi:nucleoside 2-deoxyribosyltransferase